MSYSPICFYAIAQRNEPLASASNSPYSPIIFESDLIAQTPVGGIGWFDACCQPVQDPRDAYYVVYPNISAPPSGFHVISSSLDLTPQNWSSQLATYSNIIYTPPAPIPAPVTILASNQEKDDTLDEEDQRLSETPEGYALITSKSGRKVRAANYLVDVVAVVHYHGLTEQDEKRVIRLWVHVRVPQQKPVQLELPYEDIDLAYSRIGKKVGEAFIEPRARTIVPSRLAVLIRERLAYCDHHHVYTASGWTRTPQGTLVYVHDGAPTPDASIQFKSGFWFGQPDQQYHPQRLVSNAWRLLKLSDNKAAALIPFLFAHLALLWGLFEEAGYPPHVLLFIRGKTGSLKTAVASLLYNFEARRETAIPATFRDTSASQEVKMGKYRDRVLLVDDFCPAASEISRRILEQSLEQLVRFYGDGIAKSRTNPKLSEVYEKRPHGLCAITGEDSAGSYSSLLRCLFVDIDQETYNKALLSEFQASPCLWTAHLEFFVNFCVPRAEDIINLIKNEYPSLREHGRKYMSEARLIDTYAALHLAAKIALQYSASYLGLTNAQTEAALTDFSNICMQVCVNSAAEAKALDPVKIFTRIVHEAIAKKDLVLGSKDECATNPDKFSGYQDGQYLYFWPAPLFGFVQKQFQLQNKKFPLSQNRMWAALYEAGILIPGEPQKRSSAHFEYGYRTSLPNRPRMIRLLPSAFEPYL